MTDIKKLKWRRMRYIKESLKQQPMTFEEIFERLQKSKLIKEGAIGKRSVQTYLEELCAIEVLSRDSLSGVYRFAEHERQVFDSKHDYQLALVHSKNLLFSNSKENTQRFDHINPYLVVDLLAYEPERDANDLAVLQHLKTGYPEIYGALQKYRELMDCTGLSSRSCLPKLGGYINSDKSNEYLEFDDGLPKRPSSEPFPATLPNTISNEIIKFGSGVLGIDDIIARVPASVVTEIVNLRDLIVGKIYGHIMNIVRNGAPLKGICDFCPTNEVKIR